MLAVFMVKLYGKRVHVLENNEGLLDRDYATNAPFYERFGIKSGKSLSEEGNQICYCLKSAINKHFLERMVQGLLDEDLRQTVLIVDEVDDLIVNEKPNAHYGGRARLGLNADSIRARWRVRGAPRAAYCLLYTSPSPRDRQKSRMPSSA